MKTTSRNTAHRVIVALVLLVTLGYAPINAQAECDHDHPQNANNIALPDFGFALSGACSTAPEATTATEDNEPEDELLKDIEKPLEPSSSDIAATLEENQQTS